MSHCSSRSGPSLRLISQRLVVVEDEESENSRLGLSPVSVGSQGGSARQRDGALDPNWGAEQEARSHTV